MKAFINVRDLLVWPKSMVATLQSWGMDVFVVDNDSTYPPLLEWYATKPCEVVRVGNLGHFAAWSSGLVDRVVGEKEVYFVTDHDLDYSRIPVDFYDHVNAGFARWPGLNKIAFGVEIDDLPVDKNPGANSGRGWTQQFYQEPLEFPFYKANADTHGVFHRRGIGDPLWYGNCVWMGRPYIGRHMPWYLDVNGEIPEDFAYYVERLDMKVTNSWYAFPFQKIVRDRRAGAGTPAAT